MLCHKRGKSTWYAREAAGAAAGAQRLQYLAATAVSARQAKHGRWGVRQQVEGNCSTICSWTWNCHRPGHGVQAASTLAFVVHIAWCTEVMFGAQ